MAYGPQWTFVWNQSPITSPVGRSFPFLPVWAMTELQARPGFVQLEAMCWPRMNPAVWSGACHARWSSAGPLTGWCPSIAWLKPSLEYRHVYNAAEPEFEVFRDKAYHITGLDLTSYKAP